MKRLLLLSLLLCSCLGKDSQPTPNIGNEAVSSPKSKPSKSRGTIVVFGDSLTAGQACCGNYAGYLSQIVGHNVVARGRGGEPLQSAYGRFLTVLSSRPDLIIVMMGTNDAAGGLSFERAGAVLSNMIAASKGNGIPIVVCSIPPFSGGAASANPRINAFNAMLSRTASANGVRFIDVHKYFGNSAGLFQSDGIHLSKRGNLVVATAMANGL